MKNQIKYVHTNINAKNWKKLAEFYVNVFACKPLYPERDLSGEWISKVTTIDNVRIRGIHLGLPGYEHGPTLEIFEYHPGSTRDQVQQINHQGVCHIAFHVESVEDILKKVVEHGGEQLGELLTQEYAGIGLLTIVYAKDPEGNFVEIQNWSE